MARKRDYRDIEDELDRDRAKLGSVFDSIFNRSTLDVLTREAMHALQANGGYRRTAETIVRRNPLAVAVTGLGLAWLLLGTGRRDAEEEVETARLSARRTARRARAAIEDEADYLQGEWADAVDRLRARASAALHQLEEDARAYRDDVAAGISNKAGDARDYMAERAALLADLAEDMRERFAEGLDHLSRSARERIVAAREEAYAARLRAEEAIGKGGREAKRLVEEHPMVSAAVALALGTALGAAVLHRRRHADDDEDDLEDEIEDRIRRRRR